jgi:hypothetical protein
MPFECVPEYAVRDPSECAVVRQVSHREWVARTEEGRFASGPTPASAIARLKR